MLSSFLLLPLVLLLVFEIFAVRGWLKARPSRNVDRLNRTDQTQSPQATLRVRCRLFTPHTASPAALVIGTSADRDKEAVAPPRSRKRTTNGVVVRVLPSSPRVCPQTT